MDTPCQRWREHRDSYRPAREPIDVTRYEVEPLDESPARAFVLAHHYSSSYPVARFRAGLFRLHKLSKRELVGVAVFSVPMNPATVPKYLGIPSADGVELGRLVLLDDVEANGESFFIARAFKHLRAAKPEVRAVVSYSDPLPRRTEEGVIITPGHLGLIYQATNAAYFGRSSKETLWRTRDWRVVSRRMLSKLRNDEVGAAYAYRTLLGLGAPARMMMESGPDYVARAMRDGPFVNERHPGNHVYGFHLDRRVRSGFAEGHPYPKALDRPPGQVSAA